MKDLANMSALELLRIMELNRIKIDIDNMGGATWEIYVATPGGHYREADQTVLARMDITQGNLPKAMEQALKHPSCHQP